MIADSKYAVLKNESQALKLGIDNVSWKWAITRLYHKSIFAFNRGFCDRLAPDWHCY